MINYVFLSLKHLFCIMAILLLSEISLYAQQGRFSNEEDIVVDVNVYSGESSQGLRRRTPFSDSDRETLAERLIRGGRARLIASDPEYFKLREKYPEEADRILREATIPKHILEEEKQAEANRKIAEIDLELRQADLNQKQAVMDKTLGDSKKRAEIDAEIPQARKAILNLDPSEDHFLKLFIKLQDTFPLAFQDKDFYEKVAEPMLTKHMMLQEHKLKLQRGGN